MLFFGIALLYLVFTMMVVPTHADDHDDDHDDDHGQDHHDDIAGCSYTQPEPLKRGRGRKKDHPHHHPSDGVRIDVHWDGDQIVCDENAQKLYHKMSSVANDFKLLPMDVPWNEQSEDSLKEAMETIQVFN